MLKVMLKSMLRLDKRRKKLFLSRRNSANKVFPEREINSGEIHKDKMLKETGHRKLCEILWFPESKSVVKKSSGSRRKRTSFPGINMKVQTRLLLILQKLRHFPQ